MVYDAKRGFINHPDHRACGQAVLDAVYPLARDHLSFPELLQQGLEPHCVSTVLLSNFEKHNFSIDITETIDTKLEAIGAHASQLGKDPERTLSEHKLRAAEDGKPYGYGYAELFVRIDIPA
jgi:LmbE family N-acetylglucosaminyl deacetylase